MTTERRPAVPRRSQAELDFARKELERLFEKRAAELLGEADTFKRALWLWGLRRHPDTATFEMLLDCIVDLIGVVRVAWGVWDSEVGAIAVQVLKESVFFTEIWPAIQQSELFPPEDARITRIENFLTRGVSMFTPDDVRDEPGSGRRHSADSSEGQVNG